MFTQVLVQVKILHEKKIEMVVNKKICKLERCVSDKACSAKVYYLKGCYWKGVLSKMCYSTKCVLL